MAESTRPLFSASTGEGLRRHFSALGGAAAQGARAVYNLFANDVWDGDYSPEQWRQWYAASGAPGAAPPRFHPMMQHKYDDKDEYALHQEYLARAKPTFDRLFVQYKRSLSPERQAEFMYAAPQGGLLGSLFGDTSGQTDANQRTRALVQDVRNSILGLPFNRENARAEAIRNEFLDYVRMTALLGDQRADNSVSPEQYAQWSSDSAGVFDAASAKYRLNNVGRQQLAQLADYNLLTAFQTDQIHRPEHLKSAPLSVVSNVVSGLAAPLFGDISGIPDSNQKSLWSGTPRNALAAVLTQDDFSRQRMRDDPNFAKRVWTGAAVPQLSFASPTGMDWASSNPSTALGYATNWLSNPMYYPSGYLGMTEQKRQDWLDAASKLDRVTPIRSRDLSDPVADSQDWQSDRELANDLREIVGRGYRGFSDNLPAHIYRFNDQNPFGVKITPFYPPALVNDAVMSAPAVLGDPQNLLLSALGGGWGALRGAGSKAMVTSLKNLVADAPAEMGYGTAVSVANTPQSIEEYASAPDPNVTLKTPSGATPNPANRQEYEQAVTARRDETQNVLSKARSFLDTQRKRSTRGLPRRSVESR